MQGSVQQGDFKAFSNFMQSKKCYHTDRYESDENYYCDFFQSFTYEDFTYSFKEEEDVPLQLFPTNWLSIYNEALNEQSINSLFEKLLSIKKLNAKVKKGFVRERKLFTPTDYIIAWFRRVWELQADGAQTNATIQMSSIEKFAKFLIDKGIVTSDTVFLDCGSSYGSFLWLLSQELKAFRNLRLLGIEYSDLRYVLGCHATHHMLTKAQSKTSRLDGELLHNVILQHRDLKTIASFAGSPTIVHMFDKAFNWDLCFHVLLCAIATPSVKYLISCKGHFKTFAKCDVRIRFNDLVEDTQFFKKIASISGLKMGEKSREAAGTFTIFQRTNKRMQKRRILSCIN